MSENQSQSLSRMIEQLTGAQLREKKGSRFHFNIYLNRKMSETPIEILDLKPRAYNSLKRAGFHNVGQLAEAIASGTQISNIRNCGAKSSREIMEKLFLYQYSSLPEDKKGDYIMEVIRMNG